MHAPVLPTSVASGSSSSGKRCVAIRSKRLLTGKSLYAVLALFMGTSVLIGCASVEPQAASQLHPLPLADVRAAATLTATSSRQPRIALVLGGGGVRGLAHVGVLKALEEEGIQPDIVVGTSSGAIVGAAYASGLSAQEVDEASQKVDILSLLDLTLKSGGFLRGEALAQWVDKMTKGKAIESFPRRFGAVATDLETGQAVLLERGSAGAAIQASAAMPGIITPVIYKGGLLVDGGVASAIPVDMALAMGADFVIAVDVYCVSPRERSINSLAIIGRVMHTQTCLLAARESAKATVLISPSIGFDSVTDIDEQRRAVQTGYDVARTTMPLLLERLTAMKTSGKPSAPINGRQNRSPAGGIGPTQQEGNTDKHP